MSEKQTVSVLRNGINKVLTEGVFSKKSKENAGKTLFYPELSILVPDDVTWAGVDVLNGAINKLLRTVFAGIVSDNLEQNNGQFNMAEFLEEAADFTAARESLDGINETLEELYAMQEALANDPAFGQVDENDVMTADAMQVFKKIKDNNAKIGPLKQKREEIQAEYQKRAEKRAATKAKNAQEGKTTTAAVAA